MMSRTHRQDEHTFEPTIDGAKVGKNFAARSSRTRERRRGDFLYRLLIAFGIRVERRRRT